MRKLLVSLIAAAALAIPAGAQAATFCVNSPSCVAAGGTNTGTGAKAIQNSLDQAAKQAGQDQVVVGPGTYVRAGGFSYNVGSLAGNPVVLNGAGSAQTVLQNSATSGATLSVVGQGSHVNGVRTVLGAGAATQGLWITGSNSVAHDIAVRGQANTTRGIGVNLGGATLQKGDIVSTGTQLLYGVGGDGKVVDSSVVTDDFTYGIYGPRTVQRTTIQGAGTGIMASGSALPYQFDQLRIAVPADGRGVVASSIAAGDTQLNADHLTVTGGGDGTSVGVLSEATAGGPNPHNAKIVLRSSIMRSVGHPVGLFANHGAANINIDHSDLNLAVTLHQITPGGSGAVSDMGGNLNVDPLFVSPSDRHLLPGSPVIDKGRPSLQPNESSTDLDGAARLVGPATDMGAYEVHP